MGTITLSDFLPEWFRNLIGGRDGFYRRNSYMLGQKGPVWLDVVRPYDLYNTIPQLKAVVDRKASMFANMELKIVDKKTKKEVEDKDFRNFIMHPNPMQSMNDWLRNFKQQEQVYGNQFMLMNWPSKLMRYPASISNVSPRYVRPVLTGKVFDQVALNGIISGYEYNDTSNVKTWKPEEIIYSKLNDLDNPIIGLSPIVSLRFPLTNTKLAYEYRNVIMGEKGAIGILSNQPQKDMGGGHVPMRAEEKKRIQDDYLKRYGAQDGKQRIILTEANLKWDPMTYPTKDLLLFEEVDANHATIIDHFGLNTDLFSIGKATYENVKQGLKLCYQDTIIPEADQFAQRLTKELKIDDKLMIQASYDHISILKEDEQAKATTFQTICTALNQLVSGGVVPAAQATQIAINAMKEIREE